MAWYFCEGSHVLREKQPPTGRPNSRSMSGWRVGAGATREAFRQESAAALGDGPFVTSLKRGTGELKNLRRHPRRRLLFDVDDARTGKGSATTTTSQPGSTT